LHTDGWLCVTQTRLTQLTLTTSVQWSGRRTPVMRCSFAGVTRRHLMDSLSYMTLNLSRPTSPTSVSVSLSLCLSVCLSVSLSVCLSLCLSATPHHTPCHNHLTALYPWPPGWAGARRKLLDFMVHGNINRGRHNDHPAGRHSIRTKECPPPPSSIFFTGRMPYCPSCRTTNSVKALKATSAFGLGRRC